MRYYLVDKVTSIDIGKTIKGIKCVTLTDEVLHDHFPGHPIMPGALIVEGLAQLAGFLLEMTVNTDKVDTVRRAMLVQIDKMKFYEPTGPGECLEFKITIKSVHTDAAQVQVEAHKQTKCVAKGFLNFALLEIDSSEISIQRQQLYKIWTRGLDSCPIYR